MPDLVLPVVYNQLISPPVSCTFDFVYLLSDPTDIQHETIFNSAFLHASLRHPLTLLISPPRKNQIRICSLSRSCLHKFIGVARQLVIRALDYGLGNTPLLIRYESCRGYHGTILTVNVSAVGSSVLTRQSLLASEFGKRNDAHGWVQQAVSVSPDSSVGM